MQPADLTARFSPASTGLPCKSPSEKQETKEKAIFFGLLYFLLLQVPMHFRGENDRQCLPDLASKDLSRLSAIKLFVCIEYNGRQGTPF